MHITFRSGPGASAVDVYCDGRRVGSIRRSQDGHRYEYYHGPQNLTAYAYESADLEQLKGLLSLRMGRAPLLPLEPAT